MSSFSLRESGLLPLPRFYSPRVPSPAGPRPLWATQQCPLPRQNPAPSQRDPVAGPQAPGSSSSRTPHPIPTPAAASALPLPVGKGRRGPTARGRAVSGPQFDSPFRALLPSGHCPPQNPPWLPLPTPGPHPLRHHNSFAKLPLNHLTRKQSYVYIHCYKNKIGTGVSSGVCCHHRGPGGQGDGSGVQVHPLQNGIQPDQDLTPGLSPGCFQPSRQPGTQAPSHHEPAGPGMPPEPCRLLN